MAKIKQSVVCYSVIMLQVAHDGVKTGIKVYKQEEGKSSYCGIHVAPKAKMKGKLEYATLVAGRASKGNNFIALEPEQKKPVISGFLVQFLRVDAVSGIWSRKEPGSRISGTTTPRPLMNDNQGNRTYALPFGGEYEVTFSCGKKRVLVIGESGGAKLMTVPEYLATLSDHERQLLINGRFRWAFVLKIHGSELPDAA